MIFQKMKAPGETISYPKTFSLLKPTSASRFPGLKHGLPSLPVSIRNWAVPVTRRKVEGVAGAAYQGGWDGERDGEELFPHP